MKRLFALLIAALLILGILASCGEQPAEQPVSSGIPSSASAEPDTKPETEPAKESEADPSVGQDTVRKMYVDYLRIWQKPTDPNS